MNKTLAYLFSALLAFVACTAASITHTATVFPALTDWSVTNSVPQFDPALGTLTNVTIAVSINASSTLAAENRDATARNTTATSEVTATASAAGYAAVASLTNSHSTSLSAYDGFTDFAGTSGFIVSLSSSAMNTTNAPTAPFVGIGVVPLTASASARSRFRGSGVYTYSARTFASAVVVVTYEFAPAECPPCEVCADPCDLEPTYNCTTTRNRHRR